MKEPIILRGPPGSGGFVGGGICGPEGRSVARRAMVVRGRRPGGSRRNELACSARRRCTWFAAGRFDLVLSRAPLRKPCVRPPLPHFIGARLVRPPDPERVHATRDERS